MESLPNARTVPSILIVEDDSVTCEMLGTVIHRRFPDLTIYLAGNGRTGLDRFREHTPEIVITDINMPVMDGIEMATAIKSIKADTKLIVITAYNSKEYLNKFTEIGFSDYLLKPIQFGKLFAAIEKCTGNEAVGSA